MKPGTILSSTSNPKIKSLIALSKPRERKKQQLFVIEGSREIRMALKAGYRIGSIFYCHDLISVDALEPELRDNKLLIPVTQEIFDKIAVRENSGGIVAVAEMKAHELSTVALPANPLILVLESVEKPGNLGAVLRTADAAGVDVVVVCDPQTDLYNPNTVRSSIGCVFTVPIATTTSSAAMDWLRNKGISIWCTYLEASKPYHETDFTGPSAIVMGAEATGISQAWITAATGNIIIPMQGKIDSMNVSTAAAVVIFEARRQRGFR